MDADTLNKLGKINDIREFINFIEPYYPTLEIKEFEIESIEKKSFSRRDSNRGLSKRTETNKSADVKQDTDNIKIQPGEVHPEIKKKIDAVIAELLKKKDDPYWITAEQQLDIYDYQLLKEFI